MDFRIYDEANARIHGLCKRLTKVDVYPSQLVARIIQTVTLEIVRVRTTTSSSLSETAAEYSTAGTVGV
ncbi:hypothetical protein GOBAR_AA33545 [Gossypium barbadense]|uniref:Uncharacterized protein n=1 Tax=Gossypium barbadense TaxID=3634 RepID=A0A2P5W7T3_GOSBA|nr:hypothetical protein GOBAR_AA33545 [Gossypium barbadense]